MSLINVFNISGSAMSAQTVRMNTTASNIANSNNISSSEQEAYRAKYPVFSTMLSLANDGNVGGVKVDKIVESQAPVNKRFEPNNPLADKDGYVYMTNVNMVEEMANMISTSRSYQNNVEVMNTAKQMFLNTLKLGQ